jgi:hypothetical protein
MKLHLKWSSKRHLARRVVRHMALFTFGQLIRKHVSVPFS